MVPTKRRRPDLDSCVHSLLRITSSAQTAKDRAETYIAGLGLLYHLKLDQVTIQNIRKQHEGQDFVPYPKANAIPAISLVAHDQAFFRAMVSCLSIPTNDVDTGESLTRFTHMPPGSRKRSSSVDNASVPMEIFSSKSMKVAHSPQVSKRSISYAKPQMNIKTLAATILFSAFEHLDHWPAPLVKAYADDSFGPRTWVDDPACRLLVQNLSLSHSTQKKISEQAPTEDNQADGSAVAQFYLAISASTSGMAALNEQASSPLKRRASLSSNTSQTSSVVHPFGRPRAMSTDLSSDKVDKGKDSRNRHGAPHTGKERFNESTGYDSDSGDDKEVAITTCLSKNTEEDGDSSSSGEEDEEVVLPSKSFNGDDGSIAKSSPNFKSNDAPPRLEAPYPISQKNISFFRIRQRYFGLNLEQAHLAISTSLSERLDLKSKHNSGLLQSLPNFTAIPSVRRLITANLEKWLQSPALAGLARSLFARTVNMMEFVDPPLPADLDSIDNILAMRLKANQLNAHIENLMSIAKKIPTEAVSRHIYNRLLRDVLLSRDAISSSASDHLKMINAVYGVIPEQLSADGIAAALMGLLIDRPATLSHLQTSAFVWRLCGLIREVAKELGNSFNGSLLLEAIMSFKVKNLASWTVQDEEHRGRLMFQCVTLLVGKFAGSEVRKQGQKIVQAEFSGQELENLRESLFHARKILLRWCCKEYARHSTVVITKKSSGKVANEILGAGPANYASILDGNDDTEYPRWLHVVRVFLFLENCDSQFLVNFLAPGETEMRDSSDWECESHWIRLCYENGGDVDDEMLWIVVKAATSEKDQAPPEVSLLILEHLFHGCNKDKRASLHLEDPTILPELYKIVEYHPQHITRDSKSQSSAAEELMVEEDDYKIKKKIMEKDNGKLEEIPRLAFPGLWWRVTGLALVMCGVSPERIGSTAWDTLPTLRALIKMVTSDRFFFPTIDCDEAARDEMKKSEQSMRDKEARITEFLFLRSKPKKKKKREIAALPSFGGPRSSRRQREKRERLLKKQQEKEAAEALKEANRRKKMLRAAQKSIMLWDPTKTPRKPPKESAELIFSVGEIFDLPRMFRRNVSPDFVLKTIGNTSRGAIERAYNWLIPIISFLPETISRLPASASCFLLLRAYGTEGEERAQLQELSSPLLAHVRQSLTGEFGEPDSVRAFELLLADVASHNPDRRRCARRVLYDAIGLDTSQNMPQAFENSNCAWMVNILNLRHSSAIVPDAVRHISLAASFERGRVLRFLVLALKVLTNYASEKSLLQEFDFPSKLIDLISSRPTVFAATMSSFPDLRSLAIDTVYNQFRKYSETQPEEAVKSAIDDACNIVLCCNPYTSGESGQIEVTLPLSLLEASCVILSIWVEETKNIADKRAVASLVKMLMRTQDAVGGSSNVENAGGLASATLCAMGKSAIPVESWVMLARSRSDFIAKRAALTAPNGFLPRLLLCSGLPRASLQSMIDRLGKLGDQTKDVDKLFSQLLVPSATSQWDIGRLGRRREVSRKLMGRLSAYSRIYNLSDLGEEVSFTFLNWLSKSCENAERQRKGKPRKGKIPSSTTSRTIETTETLIEVVPDTLLDSSQEPEVRLNGDASEMTVFRAYDDRSFFRVKRPTSLSDSATIQTFLQMTFEMNQTQVLDAWLHDSFGDSFRDLTCSMKHISEIEMNANGADVSCILLKLFSDLGRKTEGLGTCVVKWVPILSSPAGSPTLWRLLLADDQKPRFMWSNLVSRCCQIWTHSHLVACREWILLQAGSLPLDLHRVVRVLLHSTSWRGVHVQAMVDSTLAREIGSWGKCEDSVRRATLLSIAALDSSNSDADASLLDRNNPPDALILLLLIARLGRDQLKLVSQAIVEKIEKTNGALRSQLLAAILRLYAYFPNHMNLGVAVLRTVLKEAAEKYSTDWLSWRSSMDDRFHDTITTLVAQGGSHRMTQALIEGSKKHPLLILRQLSTMGTVLEADATVREDLAANIRRGIVFGCSLAGPLLAKIDTQVLQVSLKHWGFNYTENIWMSFLEVITMIPNEVLFGCALRMGLQEFLGIYLRLMSVQTQLRTSDRPARLKGKLAELFDAFKASNRAGWEEWLAGTCEGLQSLGTNRNVLMSCNFISHQEAVDSIKQKSQQ